VIDSIVMASIAAQLLTAEILVVFVVLVVADCLAGCRNPAANKSGH